MLCYSQSDKSKREIGLHDDFSILFPAVFDIIIIRCSFCYHVKSKKVIIQNRYLSIK